MREFRTGGTIVTLVVLAFLWFRSFRQAPWLALCLALLVVVLFGPTVQPWYFCWALVVAAAFLVDARWLTFIGGLLDRLRGDDPAERHRLPDEAGGDRCSSPPASGWPG